MIERTHIYRELQFGSHDYRMSGGRRFRGQRPSADLAAAKPLGAVHPKVPRQSEALRFPSASRLSLSTL
jgi:hypothetical protein